MESSSQATSAPKIRMYYNRRLIIRFEVVPLVKFTSLIYADERTVISTSRQDLIFLIRLYCGLEILHQLTLVILTISGLTPNLAIPPANDVNSINETVRHQIPVICIFICVAYHRRVPQTSSSTYVSHYSYS